MDAKEQLYDMEHQAFLKNWEVVKYVNVPGDGIQAPGFVTMCKIDNLQHPFVVHFFNAQDGGFHSGNYCSNRTQAEEAFTKRVLRFVD